MPPTPRINFDRKLHVALHYHVLSHLNLGNDAASIYRRRARVPTWVSGFRTAYGQAPGRGVVQLLPLHCDDLSAMIGELRRGAVSDLEDDAGRDLADHLADALEEEAETFGPDWQRQTLVAQTQLARAEAVLRKPLTRLRRALWSAIDKEPPRLGVLDAPALGASARADKVGPRRRVAVSLGEPLPQVLCEVLYTESLAISGRQIATIELRLDAANDTPSADDALAQQALNLSEAAIADHAPDFAEAHRRWRRRLGR